MKYFKLIKEIANDLNINYEILSDNYIMKLEKNGVLKYICGYKFPLNDEGVCQILDDKYAFYSVVSNLNIDVAKIVLVNNNYDREDIKNFFNENKEVIIKPNKGSCGEDVYRIDNLDELFSKIDFLLKKYPLICISPYYKAKNEYRVILLNSKVKLIYGKENPKIIGDSFHTILELLIEFNKNYYSNKKNLQDINFDLNEILESGKEVEIDFKFNLSKGARLFRNIDSKKKIELENIALFLVNKLNIKFASIDILETDNGFIVLEGNSGVMTDNFQQLDKDGIEISKEIYKEAIESLF